MGFMKLLAFVTFVTLLASLHLAPVESIYGPLEVTYITHYKCTECKRFFLDTLHPALLKLNYAIDLLVFPFGLNTTVTSNDLIDCPYEEKRYTCDPNRVLACVVKRRTKFKTNRNYYNLLKCLTENEGGGQDNCLNASYARNLKREIEKCATGLESLQFFRQYQDLTNYKLYRVDKIPGILLNHRSQYHSLQSKNYFNFICANYKKIFKKVREVCSYHPAPTQRSPTTTTTTRPTTSTAITTTTTTTSQGTTTHSPKQPTTPTTSMTTTMRPTKIPIRNTTTSSTTSPHDFPSVRPTPPPI